MLGRVGMESSSVKSFWILLVKVLDRLLVVFDEENMTAR